MVLNQNPPRYIWIISTPPLNYFLNFIKKGVNACGTARPNQKYYPKELHVQKSVEIKCSVCEVHFCLMRKETAIKHIIQN